MYLKAAYYRRVPIKKLLLFLQITTILLFSACLTATAGGHAQSITISVNKVKLEKIFKEIKKQTNYVFFYDARVLQDAKPVSIHVKNSSIEEVLKESLKDQPLDFSIEKKTVTIFKKAGYSLNKDQKLEALVSLPPLFNEIRGIVKDEKGNPLAGVSVILKGTKKGTSTGSDGSFSIEANVGDVLEFSIVGYLEKSIRVGQNSTVSVAMEVEATVGNDVVVVGYGTQKRSDLTGAISSVDLKRSQDLPNVNIMQTLQGTVPGVNVTPTGTAGAQGSIMIRGQRSISGSNAPLIVLDGIIFNGSLSAINPADIASIDVLKDVSSSAIYGSKGANGVILITTKRGTTEKPTISFTTLYGRSDYARRLPLLNRAGYLQKILDYQYDQIADSLHAQGPVPVDPTRPDEYLTNPTEKTGYANGTNTDWQNVIKQPAPQSSYNLSVAGRTKNSNYFLSGNYTDQRGVTLGNNFKRVTLHVSLESSITPWLKIGTTSFFEESNQSGIPSSLSGQLSHPSPLVKPKDSAGNVIQFPMDDQGIVNPLENSLAQNLNVTSTLEGTIYASVDIPHVKGLNYRINWSNTLSDGKNYTFWDPTTYSGSNGGIVGTGSRVLTNSLDTWLDNILTYKRLYKQHSFDLTLLYSYEKDHSEGSTMTASNFTNTVLGYNGLSLGGVQSVGQSSSSYVNLGSMARLNYSYADRYLITGTVRRDGYSAFGPNSKFGVFPSFALGWKVSEENFMRKVAWINFLKLRYSYGSSGNQGVAPYSSLAHVASNGYVFGDVASQSIGQYVSTLSNASLGWETTLGSNYGMDLSVFQSRIGLTVDYYHYHTNNILLQRSIPATTGFTNILSNIGATANQGLEITLNTVNIETRDFKWTMNFNISMNKNKITKLYGTTDPKTGAQLNDISNSWFIGHPINTIYNYVFGGIYQVGQPTLPGNPGKPGYLIAKDLNKNGQIDANDRAILGTGDPDYRAGINNTFQYKDFAFSFFVNSVHGGIANNILLDPAYNFANRNNYFNVGWWTPQNKSNTRPSLGYSNLLGMGFYESKSIIRVQDVSLSYSFPKRWLEGAKIMSLQCYISAKNPFMFTKWAGYDPELGSGSSLPNYKTLVAGLNLSF